MKDVAEQLEDLSRIEKRVAMVTLVATRGTAPKKEGSKMWVARGAFCWAR